MELMMGIAAAIALAVLLSFFAKRRMNDSWTAVITDLRTVHQCHDENGTEEKIVLKFKTEEGKRGKFTFSPHFFLSNFPDLKVGDRITKHKSELMPRKID